MANQTERFKTIVINFLKRPEDYEIKKRTERPKALTEKEVWLVKKEASNLVTSCSHIQHLLILDTSRWTI